jgi:hypothetical protein
MVITMANYEFYDSCKREGKKLFDRLAYEPFNSPKNKMEWYFELETHKLTHPSSTCFQHLKAK